MNKKILEK